MADDTNPDKIYPDKIYMDKRLQEKAVRDGKVERKALKAYLEGLPDLTENLITFDEEGNPTNLPERKLKTLAVKPGEAEPRVSTLLTPRDPLEDAWDEMPSR